MAKSTKNEPIITAMSSPAIVGSLLFAFLLTYFTSDRDLMWSLIVGAASSIVAFLGQCQNEKPVEKNENKIPLEKNPANENDQFAHLTFHLDDALNRLREDLDKLNMRLSESCKRTSLEGEQNQNENAIALLANDLAARERECKEYQSLLAQYHQRRTLSRVASMRETLKFLQRNISSGRLGEKEAFHQVTLEVESAISDLGMEIMEITPGTKITGLEAGSFTPISTEATVDPLCSGTVKSVHTEALFIKDAEGRKCIIAPAKLTIYRI